MKFQYDPPPSNSIFKRVGMPQEAIGIDIILVRLEPAPVFDL